MRFTELFVVLILFLSGIYCRFEFEIVSFALIEPFIVLFIIGSCIYSLTKGNFKISQQRFFYIWYYFIVFLFLILPFTFDLKRSLSDIRDWTIPILFASVISSFPNLKWQKIFIFFIIFSLLFSGVGFYQFLTDSFRPFASELAPLKSVSWPIKFGKFGSSIVVAFFSHSNQFANYLLCAFLICLGFLFISSKKFVWFFVLSFILLAMTLTYSKASITILPFAIFFFFFLHFFSSLEELFTLVLLALIIFLFFSIFLTIVLPEHYFETMQFRIKLFNAVVETVKQNPAIGLVGNGAKPYSLVSPYPNPHNLYLYFIIHYGMVGLGLLLLFLLKIIILTLKGFKKGLTKENPLFASVATALIFGYFFVGLTEVPLQDINFRMVFFLLISAFLGIYKSAKEKSRIYQCGKINFNNINYS